MARLGDDNRLSTDIAEGRRSRTTSRPSYAIYMFDPKAQTFLIVAAPPPGFMNTHPVAIQPRTEPNATEPTSVDPTLAAQNLGLLEVRSVYDTDGLGRMGDGVLTAADLPAGCTTAIAKTTPTDPGDTRVADRRPREDQGPGRRRLQLRRRPLHPRRARHRADAGMTGMRQAIGETEFEMQQILGYAPIEPDGSFKLTVPADTPIGLAVVDAEGRAFQTHTNWIQVRPGERRTCDGCHSPRRGGAINSGAVVNTVPAARQGDAAERPPARARRWPTTRTRLDPTALQCSSTT